MRITAKDRNARRAPWLWAVSTVLVVLGATAAWSLLASRPHAGTEAASGGPRAPSGATDTASSSTQAVGQGTRQPAADDSPRPPVDDPNDLAAWFEPGDPEPTGAEVIEALHEAGIRTGIGAFNPPGTSPPLQGLAVPDGFDLPEGYVRHHQVTDQGVPIEPILMFAPGFVLRDAQGRPVALPADRVVPPAYAPPGMPLRQARVPAP